IETVRCALNHLCEPDRLALSLRYGMKWPSSRIAKTLGTTPQAADMRLCRARIRLREVLLQMQPDFALSAL
ncbi:MAG: sigma-70 family RNA polymerase sigma factor, partial [Fuerstiella sp.]|nr:sigma-70 family RNA polymerase sigma factor [Fuerstiella sp.]